MKKTLTIAALIITLGFGTAAAQGTYKLDTVHSAVGFKIRHMISKVSGEFTDFDGTISADFNNLDASSVEFTIKADSIAGTRRFMQLSP